MSASSSGVGSRRHAVAACEQSRHVALVGKSRFGRSVCERKPATEQKASELKAALHGIGMGCHPRLRGEAPYQMELPDVGDR